MLTGCIFWQVDYAASCNANLKRYSSFDVHMYVCILLYKLYVPYIFFLYFENTWFVSFNISYYSFSFKRLVLTFCVHVQSTSTLYYWLSSLTFLISQSITYISIQKLCIFNMHNLMSTKLSTHDDIYVIM